jgi:Ca-activated chloride channel family protein
MNRVVRGSSLLIVTAIVAACAAKRDESQPPLRDPAAREDRAVQEVIVTGSRVAKARRNEASAPISSASASGIVGNVCCAPVYQQPTNTERYQHLDDNPVHLAAEQPVSTFSIDVDTGAYANVRRFLNAGQLPPQDAVRVEEMVNYFDYR